jgi:aurora kinase
MNAFRLVYQMIKKLDQGKCGKVYLVERKQDHQTFVAKVIDRSYLRAGGIEDDLMELDIHQKLHHPHIVALHDSFITMDRLILIMDYIQGLDGFRKLSTMGRFSVKQTVLYLKQVISAVAYCHQQGVMHRDIKADNLMITKDHKVYLIDFGFATTKRVESDLRGTLDYLAPEMTESKEYDYRVDVWSLGVLAYEFLCGFAPFEAKEYEDTLEKIQKEEVVFPEHVSATAGDFISRLLQKDPAKRMSLDQALSHAFLSSDGVE